MYIYGYKPGQITHVVLLTPMLQQRAHLQANIMDRGSIPSTSGRNVIMCVSNQRRCLGRSRLAEFRAAARHACASSRSAEDTMHIGARAGDTSCIHSEEPHSNLWSRVNWELLLLMSAAPVPAALAEEGLKYNAERGEGIVKTLSGVAYIGLLLYFLTKVLNRRARKAREERLAGQGPVTTVFTQLIEKATQGKERRRATPVNTAIGALQAGVIAYGLFIFTTKVETLISAQDLPAGYTAANIAITVRTIIIGLLYLVTFIFSANTLGLAGLSIQLLLFPDSIPDEDPTPRQPQAPQLPKVSVTSSTDEIRRAFDAVAKQAASAGNRSSSGGDAAAATTAGGSGNSSSSSSNEGSMG